MVNYKSIQESHDRIQKYINKTPINTSRTLNKTVDSSVFLKCENFQRGGSFKFRGVSNKLLLLKKNEKEKGIITHSSGNHAQALALGAKIFNIKVKVVMPRNTPKIKMDATKEYGADIILCGNNIESRVKTCNELIEKNDYTLIHPYDDEQIISGAGTCALELLNEVGEIDLIFCPIGGGGLISGTSIAAKGFSSKTKIIGVEPEKADDAFRSFYDEVLHPSTYPATIADGLRTSLSSRTFEIIKKNVDEIITVSENEIIEAMKFLWIRMKLIVEPSGAVSLAGLKKVKNEIKNLRIGVIISGGNVDLNNFFKNYVP
jgi:threonine dehydratase